MTPEHNPITPATSYTSERTHPLRCRVFWLSVTAFLGVAGACSSSERSFGDATGGASNGGTSNGGTSNGGTSNGGTSNGGTSNGGAPVANAGANDAGEGNSAGQGGAAHAGAAGASGGDENAGAGSSSGGSGGAGGATGESGSGGKPNLDPCAENPCKNGGSCVTREDHSFVCSCATRFTGVRCESRRFTELGSIWVTALSQDGSVVVGQTCMGAWLDCPPVKISTLPGATPVPLPIPTDLPVGVTLAGCFAHATNQDGSWIGGRCDCSIGAGSCAVEWTSSGAKFIRQPGASQVVSDVYAASSDASVVVGTLMPYTQDSVGPDQIMRRTRASGVVTIAPLNANENAYASAVANDGLLLAGSSGGHPFRWQPGTSVTGLSELPGGAPNRDQAYAVNDISGNGQIIVGTFATRGGPSALRWTKTDVTQLGLGEARGVNYDASLIVGGNPDGAAAWDGKGQLLDLAKLAGYTPDLADWDLDLAVAISDDGKVIAGNGNKGAEAPGGWVMRLP